MPASAKLEIGLIGPFSLRLGTEEVRIQGRKARALLAYLALAEGLHATRDSLLGLLWSGSAESAARASLRQCLHEVQRAFHTCGFEGFQADRSILRLSGEVVSVDVLDIMRAARSGSVHPKLPLTHRLTDSLMADLETLDGEFRDWITQTRQSIQRNLIEHLMAGTRSDTRHHHRVELAQAVLTLDPAHEGAARLLMRELAAAGNAAGALRVYKTLWDTLETEFDTEPAAETQELVAAIKLGEPVAVIALDNPPTVLVAQSSITPGGSLESLIESIAHSHGGSVVSRDQNRFVLDFSDPRAAVQSAFAMHKADRLEATTSPHLAMGAHAGHPLDDGGADIRTVASGLASTGRPGDVLVSSSVRDVLTDGLDATIQHAGADVYRIADTAAGHGRAGLGDSALLPSIAILPLEPADPGANDAVLSDIIADELIASLCAQKEMSVISRLSTRAFRGRAFTPSDLGRRLGAHYVLSGSYRVYSGQLQLTLELTDARTNTILWILRYREAVERVLDGSGDIVPQVAASIGASTLSREVERVRTRPLELLENYSLLMAAINLSHRASANSFSQARGLLELLVQRLPAHPLPLAWLAKWHVFKINQGLSSDWAQDARQAIEWAQLATELDPTCSIALTVNAWAHLNLNKRFDIADQLFDRAVEANPSDSTAWLLKGAMHAFRGEGPVAVDAARRAIHLSPLDPRRSYYDSHAATAYLSAGDYDRSIESAQRSLRLDSAHVSPLRALAIAQTLSGRIDDARETVAMLLQLDPTLTVGRYLRAHPAAAFRTGQLWAEALGIAGLPK